MVITQTKPEFEGMIIVMIRGILLLIWAVFPTHDISLLQLKKIRIYDLPLEVLPHY